jgi:hypothetical protein
MSNEYRPYAVMKKILYENMVVESLAMKFLAFDRPQSFIIMLIKARYWTVPFLVFN